MTNKFMGNITKIGKPGDIFINRAGQECVWVASDGIGPFKYRFRLLSEHEMREQEIACINLYMMEGKLCWTIDKRIYEGEISIWGIRYIYETGDWFVRFNGSTMACNKWEEPLDIVKKKED